MVLRGNAACFSGSSVRRLRSLSSIPTEALRARKTIDTWYILCPLKRKLHQSRFGEKLLGSRVICSSFLQYDHPCGTGEGR